MKNLVLAGAAALALAVWALPAAAQPAGACSFRGSLDDWRSMGVLNYEMETATLFTMCSSQGLRSGCVSGVLVNRNDTETPDEEAAARVEATSARIAIDGARRLLEAGAPR